MSFWVVVKTIFQFLPELIGLIKALNNGVNAGIDRAVLSARIKTIEKAFGHKDRRRAARELNDAFKK